MGYKKGGPQPAKPANASAPSTTPTFSVDRSSEQNSASLSAIYANNLDISSHSKELLSMLNKTSVSFSVPFPSQLITSLWDGFYQDLHEKIKLLNQVQVDGTDVGARGAVFAAMKAEIKSLMASLKEDNKSLLTQQHILKGYAHYIRYATPFASTFETKHSILGTVSITVTFAHGEISVKLGHLETKSPTIIQLLHPTTPELGITVKKNVDHPHERKPTATGFRVTKTQLASFLPFFAPRFETTTQENPEVRFNIRIFAGDSDFVAYDNAVKKALKRSSSYEPLLEMSDIGRSSDTPMSKREVDKPVA